MKSILGEGLPETVQFKLQTDILSLEEEIQSPIYPTVCKVFYPKKRLETLMSPESVYLELVDSCGMITSNKAIWEWAQQICTEESVTHNGVDDCFRSFRKIFAILVLIGKSSSISLFLDEMVSDLDLPLVKVVDNNTP